VTMYDWLVACDNTTYEYLRKNPSTTSTQLFSMPKDSTPAPEGSSDDEAQHSPTYQDSDAAFESDEDSSTTKCGAIVKAFLKKAGIADQYPEVFIESSTRSNKGRSKIQEKDPRVCVDGDKMGNDVAIGKADLEDGDQVEIVGL